MAKSLLLQKIEKLQAKRDDEGWSGFIEAVGTGFGFLILMGLIVLSPIWIPMIEMALTNIGF